jgi:hypothetical protein
MLMKNVSHSLLDNGTDKSLHSFSNTSNQILSLRVIFKSNVETRSIDEVDRMARATAGSPKHAEKVGAGETSSILKVTRSRSAESTSSTSYEFPKPRPSLGTLRESGSLRSLKRLPVSSTADQSLEDCILADPAVRTLIRERVLMAVAQGVEASVPDEMDRYRRFLTTLENPRTIPFGQRFKISV